MWQRADRAPALSAFGRRRSGLAAGVLLAVLALPMAGCDDKKAGAVPATTPPPPPAPIAEAGGACQLLDYEMIKKSLGVDLGMAAAGKRGETYTCAVQPTGGSFPDLVLAVTATKADDKVFADTVKPDNATAVPGLGKAAYAVTIVSTDSAGPGVEIGWLAGNARLLVLRYRLATSATAEEVASVQPKAVELAKTIDLASV